MPEDQPPEVKTLEKKKFINKVHGFAASVIRELKNPTIGDKILKFSNELDIRRLPPMRVNWLVFLAAEDFADLESDGEKFDKERASLKEFMKWMMNNENYKKDIGSERLEAITRKSYTKLARGLLRLATKTDDVRLRKTFRGVAWSVISKDADGLLMEHGAQPLDPEWKSSLWKLINAKDPDMSRINAELDKFAQKDASVFK